MKLTFKDVATGAFYLPARVFSGMTNLLLGSTSYDKYGDEEHSRGLFGFVVDSAKFVANLLLDATKYVARGVSNFVADHKKAIAVAFWASLAVAGAVALTVAFWPAALAAVVNFTVAGVSIASLVGSGFVAQVAATAGLAAIATSAAVYVGATIVNAYTTVRDFFVSRKPAAPAFSGDAPSVSEPTISATALSGLSTQSALQKSSSSEDDAEPVQTPGLFQEPVTKPTTPVVAPEVAPTVSPGQ